jgi:hypothetical protein
MSISNDVVVMDMYCPICLKDRLKALIKPDVIIIKCSNPDCIIGGDIDKPPYMHRGSNYFPDWKQKGLDIYDLMHEVHKREFHERVKDYWSNSCLNCGSSNVKVEKLGPWYNKTCFDCGYGSGGIPIEAWTIKEGIAFLKNHPKAIAGWTTKPLTVNGRKCWAITYLDIEENKKLVIYADYKTFKPLKVVIDYEPKPLKNEKTIQQLIKDLNLGETKPDGA